MTTNDLTVAEILYIIGQYQKAKKLREQAQDIIIQLQCQFNLTYQQVWYVGEKQLSFIKQGGVYGDQIG